MPIKNMLFYGHSMISIMFLNNLIQFKIFCAQEMVALVIFESFNKVIR